MKRKVTLLSACAAFLLAGTTVWGQSGVLLPQNQGQPEVTPRRVTSPGSTLIINGAPDANNEFGAGESMKIKPNIHAGQEVALPWSVLPATLTKYDQATMGSTIPSSAYTASPKFGTKVVPWANAYSTTTSSSLLYSPIKDIRLGSTNSRNVVIKTYTGDGFAMGWATVVRSKNTITAVDPSSYSNIESSISTFDTIPTVVADTSNAMMAFTFSKYTYRYFAAKEGSPFEVDNSTPRWDNNYNPWNATSSGLTGKSFEHPYISTTHTNHLNHLISDTVPLSTCCKSALFNMVWYSNPTTGGGYIWVWHHDGNGLNNLYVNHTYGGTSPNDLKVSDFRPGGAFWNKRTEVKPSAISTAYYTTTIDSFYTRKWGQYYFNNDGETKLSYPVDDSIALVQFSGTPMRDAEALKKQNVIGFVSDAAVPGGDHDADTIYGGGGASKIANYKRPTTVLLETGEHEFDNFEIGDIKWYYERNEANAHQTSGGYFTYCCAGKMYGYTFDPEWSPSNEEGKTLIDGAIVLKNDARVYLDKDIADATTSAAETRKDETEATITDPTYPFPDKETAALLVVADSVKAGFTLRTLGNYNKLNIYQQNMDKPDDSLFYRQATFPLPNQHVYLFEGASQFKYANKALTGYANGGAVNISAPATEGGGSVFGVFGDYIYDNDAADKLNAQIHTAWGDPSQATPTILKKDNPGVIEIGTGITDSIGTPLTVTGYKNFFVYSGGTLKNFEKMPWSMHGRTHNFAMNFTTDENTPNFVINGDAPLLIANYGSNCSLIECNDAEHICDADIYFETAGSDKLFSTTGALGTASDSGSLQVQARGDVIFANPVSIINFVRPNEVRILSDEATIQFNDDFTYNNSMDSDLVIWAKGNEGLRSCLDGNCGGYVHFAKIADLKQQKRGFTLIRSENDDVYMDDEFKYTNTANGIDNGEFIMQAGQDVYGKKKVTLNSAGQKSMLMEAKHTINLEKDLSISKTVATATKDSVTLKAGYDNFSSSAVVAEWTPAAGYACTLRDLTGYANPTYTYYGSRNACQWTEGGDIWLQGPVNIDYTTAPIDSVTTILRAFNSIYFDDKLDFSRTASGDSVINEKSVGGQGQTMLFAETGNIEAIKGSSKDLTFTMGNDSSLLTIQAGNMIENECAAPTQFNCWVTNGDPGAEYDGNILFNNKLLFTSTGTGNFLMSSARDIETQISGDLDFTYTEPGLKSGDVLITAGRHVETHAPAKFNYPGLDDTAKITIQAGRIDDDRYVCSDTLCKVAEYGTQLTKLNDATLAYDPANVTTTISGSTVDNEFAQGGMGHGSILAFKNMEFNYKGVDTILMTALNGNIESDPYLNDQKTYNTGNALIQFNHEGNGITRMEAIDIKLHDALEYNGTHHTSDSNGWFYMAAFDSILTRNLTYVNQKDKGSVSITTDKIKMIGNSRCEESIRQGHIVLGYGADCSSANTNDQILFDLDNNPTTVGANILIEAGMAGFSNRTDYKKNLYGGNITFDYMLIKPAVGDHTAGGYTKIHTPNGNIWGKDSLTYIGHEGDLLVDAGIGSADDNEAIRWNANGAFGGGTAMQTNGHLGRINNAFPNGSENTLNTRIPNNCNGNFEWRTGNIMIKGGSLTYPTNEGGYATFRTRAGYIDLYDKFDVTGMTGQLLVYAHSDAVANDTIKQYSDVSTRDFHYEPSPSGASVYFGADDNIMFNYGNGNGTQEYTPDVPCAATGVYAYDYDGTRNNLHDTFNPFYSTSYKTNIDECRSIFNVNTNGYQWYNQWTLDNEPNGAGDPYIWKNGLHMLYRGGKRSCNKSGIAGTCETPSNGARDIEMNFSSPRNGGFAAVANNYIDFFTKFTYIGGQGNGLENPSVGSIVGERVSGYGLYLKSRYQGAEPEKRRITCFMCMPEEWPYVGFHDDARIHTENQKSLIEGPVIEFFGHAELDSYTQNNGNGKITLKGDSLIFHDSAIFDGTNLELVPFTTDADARANNFRYGVMNDKNANKFYKEYGMAIQMVDRGTPVLELGYQRCNEPLDGVHKAPNTNSKADKESTPMVGGDIIVAFKNGFSLPIYNTVVANHARISFVSDSLDGVFNGGEYVDTYIRTDLLRIRNKVEFYTGEGTGNNEPKNRRGVFKMASYDYMADVKETGIYPHHLHMEPGSELSLPGEDSLIVNSTTTVGGYGNIHENVFVKANGTIAPGYASLMEEDCCTPHGQGKLTVHNLTMEKDAIFRVSVGRYNEELDEDGHVIGHNATGTDVLQVEDSIFFNGKIPLHILLEGDKDLDAILDPGCYLFLEYNDSIGSSKEYVKNFTLPIDRYQDNYFGLDYSTPGKVYLCVMSFPQPVVERYVKLPAVEGVTTTPNAGTHYVVGHQNFSFTAKYSGTPLKVTATGYYHGGPVDLDQTATILPDGSYQYTIMQVVQPYDVEFGPETSSVQVGNDYMGAPLVYSYKNTLHINVDKEDIVSIYNMTGVLYRKIEVPAGNSKFTLDKGMYIVTLKDGSVHKIVIK